MTEAEPSGRRRGGRSAARVRRASPTICPVTPGLSGGSGEQAIVMAAAAQMAAFYELPSNLAAGMMDSKVVDVQSGFEKGYSVALALT